MWLRVWRLLTFLECHKSWYSGERDTLCTGPNSAISWWCTWVQLHDTAVSILYAGPMSMGVFLSHPNHRSKPYLISTLAGWRDQESARHTWVCPVLTLSWVRYGFRSYHMREHQRSNLSSWEWCQMALCVIYPVPGLLHSKGKDGNLKQCQPGTILPPELGLQDLQEPQRTVITNYSWLASVVAYESNLSVSIMIIEPRREWDSNPQSCRPDGNKSDALTTRPRRYAFLKYHIGLK